MTARRTGAMGEYEARTQGVPVAVSYRDNRGRSIVPPSAAVRHSFHFETGSLDQLLDHRRSGGSGHQLEQGRERSHGRLVVLRPFSGLR